MKRIQITARGMIHKDGLEQLKELAAQFIHETRERDSGTLQYEWFLNESKLECVVRQTFLDSQAVLEHLSNLRPLLPAMNSVATWSFEVCGNPTPEFVEATKLFNLTIYAPLHPQI